MIRLRFRHVNITQKSIMYQLIWCPNKVPTNALQCTAKYRHTSSFNEPIIPISSVHDMVVVGVYIIVTLGVINLLICMYYPVAIPRELMMCKHTTNNNAVVHLLLD